MPVSVRLYLFSPISFVCMFVGGAFGREIWYFLCGTANFPFPGYMWSSFVIVTGATTPRGEERSSFVRGRTCSAASLAS
jgi:hypothetical protein